METDHKEVDDFTTERNEDYSPEDSFKVMVYLYVLAVTSIITFIANLIIIFIICSFRRLRRKSNNIIILHWSIMNATYMILEPSFLRLGLDIEGLSVPAYVVCIIEEIENTIIILTLLFVLFLTIYWYNEFYNLEKLLLIERKFKYIMFIIYSVSLFCLIIHVESCIQARYVERLSTILVFFIFIAFIALMVIINVTHQIRKRIFYYNQQSPKNLTNYYLTNAYFLSNLPVIVSSMIVPIFTSSDILIFIFGVFSVLNPVYNLIILYNFDDDFNLFCNHVLKCKTINYPDEFTPEMEAVDDRY